MNIGGIYTVLAGIKRMNYGKSFDIEGDCLCLGPSQTCTESVHGKGCSDDSNYSIHNMH